MKNSIKTVVAIAVVGAVAAGTVSWCWKNRDTVETRRAVRKEVAKELRATPSEGVLAYLEQLAGDKRFHAWFEHDEEGKESPYRFWSLRMGMLTRVPYDYIAQLTEDQFIRFAGNGGDKAPDGPRLKELLAFSQKLIPHCSPTAAASLHERRLDGMFLAGDYDGAIAALESGTITKRSPLWCKGTAAKLRAHKAMDANDYKEAVKQLLVFGEFMLSDEQKDFEDCDPTTGILYSREWVVARNYMRCSNMSDKLGDAAKAAEYKALAKKYFATALEKAKDDKKSLDALKEEVKPVGL